MPTNLNLASLDWLESRKGCTRYAIDCEESLWVCNDCDMPADPDEGGCIDCHPENFATDDEDETEECVA